MKILIAISMIAISFNLFAKNSTNFNLRQILQSEMSQAHKPLSNYKTAKRYIFGKLHLSQYNNGTYYIAEEYCGNEYTDKDFKQICTHSPVVGPMLIPHFKILNCEHTWPKGWFIDRYSMSKEKYFEYKESRDFAIKAADLHHLFPVNSEANSARRDYPFGEVDTPEMTIPHCDSIEVGYINDVPNPRQLYMTPPAYHRGNVARAKFYFSIRYNRPIGPIEETFLRKWHKEDPVDEFETWRNNEIAKIQGNKNIFIERPYLVEEIKDF